MTTASLVLPTDIVTDLRTAALNELETAGVLLCGSSRMEDGMRLLGRELHLLSDDDYDERRRDRLTIPSRAYVPVLSRAAEIGATALFLHTHPTSVADPIPSEWDDKVDEHLLETFRVRTGSDIYASMVISPTDLSIAFTSRGMDGDTPFEIGGLFVAGDRLALLPSYNARVDQQVEPMFDRQVRAFGHRIQGALGRLRVGIVGCGGTGSAVAEQLVRLGVRSFVVVDDDYVDSTNVTRLYGSTPKDAGKPKVTVLADHLLSIAPVAEVMPVQKLVLDEAAARSLTSCHVVFGCTDDNAGRLVLTRLAAYYLIPYVDCGVLISSRDGVVNGIHGRVTVQTPGAACLVCRGRIDIARAAAEQLPASERVERQREGYAPELGQEEPAVIAFTNAVASQAVTELLERFIGFGGEPVPTEVLLRFHDRETSGNREDPRRGHYCHPGSEVLGSGDADPFLGQLWKAS